MTLVRSPRLEIVETDTEVCNFLIFAYEMPLNHDADFAVYFGWTNSQGKLIILFVWLIDSGFDLLTSSIKSGIPINVQNWEVLDDILPFSYLYLLLTKLLPAPY